MSECGGSSVDEIEKEEKKRAEGREDPRRGEKETRGGRCRVRRDLLVGLNLPKGKH